MSKAPAQQTIDLDEIQNPKFNASSLDFLLIELVPLAQRVTERLQAREQALLDEHQRSKIFNTSGGEGEGEVSTNDPTDNGNTGTIANDAAASAQDAERQTNSLGFLSTTSAAQEAMALRLSNMGYRVGQGLVERFSANTPRPQTPLDVIKFLCKDLWLACFRKQIDNLKTNHRGVFVLTDNRFHPLSRMSIDRRAAGKVREESLARAQMYLCFPSGVICGALSGLGMEATVDAECTELPTAIFHIKTKGSKA